MVGSLSGDSLPRPGDGDGADDSGDAVIHSRDCDGCTRCLRNSFGDVTNDVREQVECDDRWVAVVGRRDARTDIDVMNAILLVKVCSIGS